MSNYLVNKHKDKSVKKGVQPPKSLPTAEENITDANKLYQRVKGINQSSRSLDEEKAKLIIELADDAIREFGTTNQDKKVELKKIKADAEKVLPPSTIEELRKRAEAQLLQKTYPRHRGLRSLTLLIIAIVSISIPTLLVIRELTKSQNRTDPSEQNKPTNVVDKPTPQITNTQQQPEQLKGIAPQRASSPRAQIRNQASQYISQCQRLYDQADFKGALSECDKALSADPSNQTALRLKDRINKTIRILNKQ